VVIAAAPEAGASAERGHVFVLGEDDVVRRVEVQLGDAAGGERRVLSGLAGGESLVLSPPETLQDGDRVKRKTSR
jgi:hypothetical protein